MYNKDTISAISTAVGSAGIGIIRLSGKDSIAVADKIFFAKNKKSLRKIETKTATLGYIKNFSGEIVDEVIVLIMRAPKSYTCEDVVEIQSHGGGVVLQKILSLTLQAGARLAERGEFTKRAFLNGRLDLTQAQAVMDIIQAKTSTALNIAQKQLQGKTGSEIRALREEILKLLAHIEALIDFPEDEVEELSGGSLQNQIDNQLAQIKNLLTNFERGKIFREGLATAIIGKPNVGKSSLLNFLTDSDRAIVTDIPGTTRDVIEEFINLDGVPVKIIDTAGIRNADNLVEQIGVEKSRSLINDAQLILALFDSSKNLSAEDFEILQLIKNRRTIILLTKTDLPEKISVAEIEKLTDAQIIKISTKTGAGMYELQQAVVNFVGVVDLEQSFIRTERDADILHKVQKHLQDAKVSLLNGLEIDFISIDLHSALELLGEITGEGATEDVIDKIFATFCIGK